MKNCLLAVLILVVSSSAAYGSGIGTLRAIAASQKDAQRTYAEETRAFERVKSAIDEGKLKKGQPKKEVEDRYGAPVVNIPESGTGREKWIYKPAKSSFFAGVRAALYFDKDDNLDEWKITE